MNILDSIKKHLYYDYALTKASVFLDESIGIYDPLLTLSEEIYKKYLNEIKDSVLKTKAYMNIFSIDGKELKDSFFDKLVIKTHFYQERVPMAEIGGCYLWDESGEINGEYVVTIYISSNGQDDDFYTKFICFMCHELAHAYDDYCEYKSTGQSYVRSVEREIINRAALQKIMKLSSDQDIMNLYSILNYTLKSEQEAEQASFASEIMLKRKGNLIAKYSSMVDFFHDTEAYKTLKKRESELNSLKNIEDTSKKDTITNLFNDFYIGSHRNYNEIMNFLTKKFNERKHRLIKIGSKSLTKTIECFTMEPLHFHLV